jgi:hypothetical protein
MSSSCSAVTLGIVSRIPSTTYVSFLATVVIFLNDETRKLVVGIFLREEQLPNFGHLDVS